MVVGPAETLEAADIVSCWGIPTVREKLFGDTLMPDGGVAVTCTLLENPSVPLTETWADCVPLAAITRIAGCADNEKSGCGPDEEPDEPPPLHEINPQQIAVTTRPITAGRIPDSGCA